MTDLYVVVVGHEEHIKQIHGVYTYEDRADIAKEEVARMYSDSGEWVAVQTHEAIAEPAYEADNGGGQ